MPRKRKSKLIDFDGPKMGKGLSEAIGTFKALEKDGKVLSYFCDVKGVGAFTPMIASAAATYIREGIQGKRQITGLGGLPKLEEATVSKKGHGRFHYWSGSFAESITYKVTSYGKKNSGHVTLSKDSIKDGTASYGALAKWLEEGTDKIPARPVMQLSIHSFVSKKLPVLLRETKQTIIQDIINNHKSKKDGPSFDTQALAGITPAKTFQQLESFKQSSFGTQGKAKARKILNKAGFASARLDKW